MGTDDLTGRFSRLYTPAEVAEILRASRSHVYDLIQAGDIAVHRISRGRRGAVRISEDDLRDYLARCRVETRNAPSVTTTRKLKHIRI